MKKIVGIILLLVSFGLIGSGIYLTLNNNLKLELVNKNVEIKQEDQNNNYDYSIENAIDNTLTLKKDGDYSVKINANINDFESLSVNNILFEKDIDFILTDGSTIITFTEIGLNKIKDLKTDSYQVIVKFINNKILFTMLVEDENIVKTEEDTNTKEITYYCENGYSLKGDKCTKEENIDATGKSTCETGTLKNNKCYDSDAYAEAEKTCSNGYHYEIVNELCVNDNDSSDTKESNSYTCENRPEGGEWELSGNKCYKITEPTIKYSCSNGYTLSGKKCIKTITIDALKKE